MNRELRKMKFRAIGSAALILVAVAFYVGFASMTPSAAQTLELKVEQLGLTDYLVHVNSANESETSKASSIEGVEEVEYRLVISSRMQWESEIFSSSLVGIDPTRIPTVNSFEIQPGDGTNFTGDYNGTALLEKGFANTQGIEPDDSISVLTSEGYVELTVIGLVFSPEYLFLPVDPQSIIPFPGTLAVVYLPIDWLRDSFGFPDDYVNEFNMLFEDNQNEELIRAAVDEQYSSNVILYSIPKDQIYGYALIKADIDSGDDFAGIMAFLILLVAFFIVYASFSRIVQEQRKEIGVLRALGYSRRSVWFSYLYMAFVIGLISSILGLIVALPIGQGFSDYYMETIMFTKSLVFEIPSSALFAGILFGPLTACLACGIAVWGTVSLDPQDAIRGVHHRKKIAKKKQKDAKDRRRRVSYIMLYTFRNMSRHKLRTSLTTVAVACSILLGGMAIMMIESFVNSIEQSVEEYEKWDLIVDYSFPLNETTAESLSSPDITDTVQISKMAGKWHLDNATNNAIIIGLERDQTLHEFNIAEGDLAENSDEIMIGYLFSIDYEMDPGDMLTIETSNGAIDFTVTAVVYDMLGDIYVDLDAVEQISGLLLFSGMYVTCTEGLIDDVKDELLLSPLIVSVQAKDSLESGLVDMMESYSEIIYIFSLVGVLISTITIANIVYVGILERYSEYGQLRAVGYSKRDISKSILSEITVIIAIGSVVGVPLMWFTLEAMVEFFKEFWPLYETVLTLSDWIGYVFVIVLVFLFGFLAALPGIRYLNKMDIAKTVAGGQFG